MKSTDLQEIEEQDFLESFALLPAGFILIKHPIPNLSIVEVNGNILKELSKVKWIAAIDYNSYKGGGLTINRNGVHSAFKYFVTGETAQEAVAKLVKILPNTVSKGAKL